MTIVYILLTFGVEIGWLYGFTKELRSEDGKNFNARDTFHSVLNNILPFSVLIFGYAILLDAFRSSSFASDGQHIEFYIRCITSLIFVIAYVYLFYELMAQLESEKDQMTGPPNDTWSETHEDNNATKYDNVLDILYNLFQPLSVLLISGIMYFIIRATFSNSVSSHNVGY